MRWFGFSCAISIYLWIPDQANLQRRMEQALSALFVADRNIAAYPLYVDVMNTRLNPGREQELAALTVQIERIRKPYVEGSHALADFEASLGPH
jgi:hypothetical protein